MTRIYDTMTDTTSSPASSWAAVTPDDNADLPGGRPKALWANVGGNIACVGADGVPFTFAVQAGVPIPLRPMRVKLAGTTATGIAALY